MRELSDVELRALVLTRDDGAWREFVRRFDATIKGACGRVLGVEGADDAAGDTYVNLLANDMFRLRVWDGTSCALKSWVFLIARNTAFDMKRVLFRHAACRIPQWTVENRSTLEALIATETTEQVRAAFTKLNRSQRRIVEALCRDDLDAKQIAEAFGLNVKTVHSMKFKAIGNLRRLTAETSATKTVP